MTETVDDCSGRFMFGFVSLTGDSPQQLMDSIVTDSDWSIVYQIVILLCVPPAFSVCSTPEPIGWTLRSQLNLPDESQTFLLVKLKSRCF